MKLFKRILSSGFVAISIALLCFSPSAAAPAMPPNTIYLPLVTRMQPVQALPTGDYWLDWVNFYRGSANLPTVTENAAWSDGDYKHAIYTVRNNVLMHDEDPANPYYTPEGQTAAKASNIMASSSTSASDRSAIEAWMRGPFHAVGILDPHLTSVGFGSFRAADGGYQMAAALNVISGLNSSVTPTYPVYWPGNGASVPLYNYGGGESPDPLSSCGYSTPTGLPLIIQFGSWTNTPAVTAFTLSSSGSALELCEFDQTNYTNPTADTQSLARSVLMGRNAVVLVPRKPLVPGQSYTASVTNKGVTYTWTFSISH